MIVRVGFKGTRMGMTPVQMRGVYWALSHFQLVNDHDPEVNLFEAHHGDCIGADAEFHVIATVLGWRTVAHPPVNDSKRAWCKADEIREPRPYLTRDWDIVYETLETIAAPDKPEPRPNSGTWTTVGYANQLRRPVRMCLPDGRVIGNFAGHGVRMETF